MGSDPHLVGGGLVDELLVTALHGDVPHVVPDVLRLHPTSHTPASAQKRFGSGFEGERNGERERYPAVRGLVDVVLAVAHDAEEAADDAQRQHGLQPVQPEPRHREPDGETADGSGTATRSRFASYPAVAVGELGSRRRTGGSGLGL